MIKLILALGLLDVTYCLEPTILEHTRIEVIALPPPYFEKAPVKAQKEYTKIMEQSSLTIAQQKEKIRALAEENNLQKEYKKAEDRMKEYMEKVEAKLNNMPSVNNEYMKILNNRDQTKLERNKKLHELRDKYPNEYDALVALRYVVGTGDENYPLIKQLRYARLGEEARI